MEEDNLDIYEDIDIEFQHQYTLDEILTNKATRKPVDFDLHQLGAASGFFFEFESLVLHLTEHGKFGIDWNHGGQFAHLIWSVEKLLALFNERNTKFSILVVKSHIGALTDNPSRMLAHKILLIYFLMHINVNIYILDDKEGESSDFSPADAINSGIVKGPWKGTLLQLLDFTTPSFIIISTFFSNFAHKCMKSGITTAYLEGALVSSRTIRLNTMSFPKTSELTETAEWVPWSFSEFPLPTGVELEKNLRAKIYLIAINNFLNGIHVDPYVVEFSQLLILHLVSIEQLPLKYRAHAISETSECVKISNAFINHWKNFQIALYDALEPIPESEFKDVQIVDLMDGRLFWKLWDIILTLSESAPNNTDLTKYLDLPDVGARRFNFLWNLVYLKEPLKKEVTWPIIRLKIPSPSRDELIFKSLEGVSIRGLEDQDIEKICSEAERIVIPCKNEMVDLVREQFKNEQEPYYHVCEVKDKINIKCDVVPDSWEDIIESEDDSVLASTIERGVQPFLVNKDNETLNFLEIKQDMELYWFARSRHQEKKFKKRGKGGSRFRIDNYFNLRALLEVYSASLNLSGFKRLNGFSLHRRPHSPPVEHNVVSVKKETKKIKAKPGSKKAQAAAKEMASKKVVVTKSKDDDQKWTLQNLKERFDSIKEDFEILWNLMWTKFTSPKYIVEARLWVMQLMCEAWVSMCRKTQGQYSLDDESYPVLLYRLAADTWFDYPDIVNANAGHKKAICDVFQCIGYYSVARQFEESFELYNRNPKNYQNTLAKSNAVPSLDLTRYSSNTSNKEYVEGMSDVMQRTHLQISPVYFQFLHMGHLMDRNTKSEKDDRVPFFPDDWQKRLLDIIDTMDSSNPKSALVCAPTSSGKTFASFYLIERILKYTDNGVVVYVCPTKALVNQAEADIYARFKNFNLNEGQSLVGSCLREYRVTSYEKGMKEDGKEPYEGRYFVRVLVTIPACLDQILLSVSGKLRPDIRGVIFDEIHCLNDSNESGGLVWENILGMVTCPFLALSATIGQMDNFVKWLNSLHGANNRKVELIHVKERFSDIRLNVWVPKSSKSAKRNTLIQIHPVSFMLDQYQSSEMHAIPQSMAHKVHLIEHLNLTALEGIQLYEKLAMASKHDVLKNTPWVQKVAELEPESLFSNYICITQTQQREWCKKLLQVFRELAEDSSHYEADFVVRNLANYTSEDLPRINSTKNDLVNLVAQLRIEKKLPAIVFCFSPSFCRCLAESLLNAFDCDNEDDDEESIRFAPLARQGQIYSESEMDELLNGLKTKCVRVPESYFECLKNGIGIHYSSLDRKFLSEVERLFRERHLQIVVSTNTLALGVNMPCKTVIFAQDTPELNAIQYRQMSGRAGRRGYDYIGDVVFLGLDSKKIQRLVFSDIPPLIGSFPTTSSLVLRMMKLNNAASKKEIVNIRNGITNLICRSLYGYDKDSIIQKQLWFHFRYTLEYLWNEYLLDTDGIPQNLAGTINNLSHLEPFNMVLNSFFLSPALAEACENLSPTDVEIQIINILSRFVSKPCEEKIFNIVGKRLEPLNPELDSVYKKHVSRALNSYSKCLQSIVSNLKLEEKLPFSKNSLGCESPINRTGLWKTLADEALKYKSRSSYVATSGKGDLFNSSSDLCFTLHSGIPLVPEALPVLVENDLYNQPLVHTNHFVDFYKNTGQELIPKITVLRAYDINDDKFYDELKFLTETTRSISLLLEKALSGSNLTETFKNVTNKLLTKFDEAYPNRSKKVIKPRDIELGTIEEDRYMPKGVSSKMIRKFKIE